MKPLLLRQLSIALFGSLLLSSCQKEDINNQALTEADENLLHSWKGYVHTYNGPVVPLGNGFARSWYKVGKKGLPLEIGIEISAATLRGLTNGNANLIPEHETIVLPLPARALQTTRFRHLGLNWNPHGHPPPGIFDPAHFDFHFYLISNQERLAIPAYSINPGGFNNMPTGDYLPAGFGAPPGPDGAEPAMGKHLLQPHVFAPGFQFVKEMIYGSYNGKLIFVEPMITLDHLLSGAASTNPYGQPKFYSEPGFYPTVYKIWKDQKCGNHFISLSEFRWFGKNCQNGAPQEN